MTPKELALSAVKILDDKKAMDISAIAIEELTIVADYFVLATGGSDRQVQALCDHVEEELAKQGIFHTNKEGYRAGDWVLLGYDDAIVHIFQSETRDFYDLEHIWQDATPIDMSDIQMED
ncbi:MAG: ribosome silencing factor [Clostridia bacterium]|nr:ribosome silencing factor [Clostridia bacterium]